MKCRWRIGTGVWGRVPLPRKLASSTLNILHVTGTDPGLCLHDDIQTPPPIYWHSRKAQSKSEVDSAQAYCTLARKICSIAAIDRYQSVQTLRCQFRIFKGQCIAYKSVRDSILCMQLPKEYAIIKLLDYDLQFEMPNGNHLYPLNEF